MSLEAIFKACGCDKAAHHYHRFYETLPRPEWLCEIGVHRGASLKAWRQFWPDVRMLAVDTFQRGFVPHKAFDDADCGWVAADSRTWKPATVWRGVMNLLIDDGSHKPRDQAATLRNLWPLLAPGGVYVIEDVVPVDVIGEDQLPEWFRRKPQQCHFTMAAFLELACAVSATGAPWERHDYRHLSGKPDSVLIVLRKP